MCAIVGLLSKTFLPPHAIQAMAAAVRHRGPDDEGYLVVASSGGICLGGVDTLAEAFSVVTDYRPVGRIGAASPPGQAWLALGHRRLSILDLSPLGHQPMAYAARYWVVYNGEIYNYLELRSELESAGHRFGSHTDTEVILAAYSVWGTDCFNRFNGMWAMAIYDQQEGTLVLSRDRFGVKPLYYWASGGTMAFASEIKAFTVLPGWQPRINGQAVHDFLLCGMQDHSRETMFAGVLQIEPGCFARIDCREWRRSGKEPQTTRWYQLKPRPFSGSFADAAEGFRELFTDSVRLRLRSDVPVGSCLSGGLDSSSIVCVANRLLRDGGSHERQQTFSSCSEIKRFDEREFVENVVEVTGVRSKYVFPTGAGLFEILDKLTWHQDEPFASTSIFAQWCVFRAASESNVKVMLDGQGADELLYGYGHFQRAFLASLVRERDITGAWGEARALRGTTSRATSAMLRALADAVVPLSLQSRFRSGRNTRRPPSWLSRSALGASFPGPLAARFQQHTSVQELSATMLSGGHLQRLLHWEDRNSMAHSVESRVPFLDFRLAEFVLGLPDRYKLRQGVSKAVLRTGMAGIVPDSVLQRRDKIGFATAEEVWAQGTSAQAFKQQLADAVDAARPVLNSQAVGALESMQAGQTPYDASIWRIISFGRWLRLFNVRIDK